MEKAVKPRQTYRLTYTAPRLVKLENVRDITRECPNWQCSVVVPPPPA